MVGWHHRLNGHGFGVDSRSWSWTGRPGVLRFMGSQRVGHDWVTELNWQKDALEVDLASDLRNKHSYICYHASAAAELLQSCPTLCDPIDGSPPGSPIPGFSRQEHWSGLPFPSPIHESEKWKWSRSVVSDSSPTHGLQPTRLLHPWDFPGKSTGVGCHRLLPSVIMPITKFTKNESAFVWKSFQINKSVTYTSSWHFHRKQNFLEKKIW